MLRNNDEIKLKLFIDLFDKYDVFKEDISFYKELIYSGDENTAIDLFIEKYFVDPSDIYQSEISRYLLYSEKGEMKQIQKSKLERAFNLLTLGMVSLFVSNFDIFLSEIIGPVSFKKWKIQTEKVKNTILAETLNQFNLYTHNTLINTQMNVLSQIRKLQNEMIYFNQRSKLYYGERLDYETSVFKKELYKKLPELQKLKDSKIIKYRPDKNGVEKYYKLTDYIDMSVRTTLLNVDRTSVQVSVLTNEAERVKKNKNRVPVNVVRYAKVDNRTLKTGIRREICQEILGNKKYGVPLLALDTETASLLGIPTVDEVRTTPDYAMGPYCTHGILPINSLLRRLLEKIIKDNKRT